MGTQYTYNSGANAVKANWDLDELQVQRIIMKEGARSEYTEYLVRTYEYHSYVLDVIDVLSSDKPQEYKDAAIALLTLSVVGGDIFLIGGSEGALEILEQATSIVEFYDQNFDWLKQKFPEHFDTDGINLLLVKYNNAEPSEVIENPGNYPSAAPELPPSFPVFAFPDQRQSDNPEQDIAAPVQQAGAASSPLVLDLDGDGIELAAMNESGSVYWDIDLDGFGEASGWIAGGDGL